MASWGYRVGAFLVDLGLVLGAAFAAGPRRGAGLG